MAYDTEDAHPYNPANSQPDNPTATMTAAYDTAHDQQLVFTQALYNSFTA